MTAFCNDNAEQLSQTWRDLADRLVAKYSDGHINPGPRDASSAKPIGYPANWLAETNYAKGPVNYLMSGTD